MKSWLCLFTKIMVTACIVFYSTASFAINNFLQPTIYTLSAGPTWANEGDTQTLTLADEIVKTYTVNHSGRFSGTAEFFVGIQKILSPVWFSQIGLALSINSGSSISGEIWDDADPEFNNFNDHYRVSHTALTFKGKFLRDFGWNFYPWISVNLGIALNRSYNFNNDPKIFEAIQNPNFSNRTVTAFTYALGIGIQRRMTCNYQIGLGYEFSDWGRSELGKATGQTTNQVLSLNHFYAHNLLVNITYDTEDSLR